jgi:hypothetical protein
MCSCCPEHHYPLQEQSSHLKGPSSPSSSLACRRFLPSFPSSSLRLTDSLDGLISLFSTLQRAYSAGYSACLADVLQMINHGVSSQPLPPLHSNAAFSNHPSSSSTHFDVQAGGMMTIGRILDWIEARQETIRQEEDDEDMTNEDGGSGGDGTAPAAGTASRGGVMRENASMGVGGGGAGGERMGSSFRSRQPSGRTSSAAPPPAPPMTGAGGMRPVRFGSSTSSSPGASPLAVRASSPASSSSFPSASSSSRLAPSSFPASPAPRAAQTFQHPQQTSSSSSHPLSRLASPLHLPALNNNNNDNNASSSSSSSSNSAVRLSGMTSPSHSMNAPPRNLPSPPGSTRLLFPTPASPLPPLPKSPRHPISKHPPTIHNSIPNPSTHPNQPPLISPSPLTTLPTPSTMPTLRRQAQCPRLSPSSPPAPNARSPISPPPLHLPPINRQPTPPPPLLRPSPSLIPQPQTPLSLPPSYPTQPPHRTTLRRPA